MNKIKKRIFFIIKSVIAIVAFLTVLLFFYTAIFYKRDTIERETTESQAAQEEKLRLEKKELQKKINEVSHEEKKIEKIQTTIKDGLFITVGDRAITKSDVVNEIKIILILNGMSYDDSKREDLQKMAVKSIIKQNIKALELSKNDFLEFSQKDLNFELDRIASSIDMDVDTLKNICKSNGLDFSIIKNQIKTELLWNSLIFYLYKNRISVNLNEIDEQLKLNQNKTEFYEYLISEIIIKSIEKDKLDSKIEEVKNKIKTEGFEGAAMSLSISKTATKGGNLGWVNENEISKKFRLKISNTPVGSISEPILINGGILIFKVRDRKKIEKKIDLEELKNELVETEKTKILNMYAMSHYDNIRRSVSIKYFNE